jgi:hypothetical protein
MIKIFGVKIVWSVPTSIPHHPHICSNQYTTHQFQPVYHTIHTSVTTSIPHHPHITSNQYTTPSTHQFQPVYHTIHTSVPTSIPHRPHICSNQYATPSTHHLHTKLKLTTSLHQASLYIDQSVHFVVMFSARFLKFVIKADSINKVVINRV